MAITEQQRHQLFQKLEGLIGIEEATTLMEHLPPVGWADVATRTDLDHHQALTRSELERHHAVMTAEIGQLNTELRTEIGQLSTELRTEIGQLEIRLERGFREQTRTMVLTNVGSMAALASVLIAAVRL